MVNFKQLSSYTVFSRINSELILKIDYSEMLVTAE